MTERLTYSEFKEELLLKIAIAVKADTSTRIDPSALKDRIQGLFRDSWIESTMSDLENDRFISGSLLVGGGGSYHLTGYGLQEAERLAIERGTDVYELIDESEEQQSETDSYVIGDPDAGYVIGEPEATSIVKIDNLSEAFKELDRELHARILELRSNNELMMEGGAEAQQHIAELEAGKILINAEQADAGLVRRLLLPSLTWFAKKVRDESASALIKKLIALVVAFLSDPAS